MTVEPLFGFVICTAGCTIIVSVAGLGSLSPTLSTVVNVRKNWHPGTSLQTKRLDNRPTADQPPGQTRSAGFDSPGRKWPPVCLVLPAPAPANRLAGGCFIDEFRIEVFALSKLSAQKVSPILSRLVGVGCEERGKPSNQGALPQKMHQSRQRP